MWWRSWLKLPPLVKIPDEPVEEFDTRKAIAEMKEALAEEEARARRIKLGLEEPPPEPVSGEWEGVVCVVVRCCYWMCVVCR